MLKWLGPIFAVIALLLVLIFLSRPTMGRASSMDSVVEWLAAIATILSAIAGALAALKKPQPPEQAPNQRLKP